MPASTYAEEYLVKLGLWQSLRAKVVPLDTVRAVLAAIEAGNAEAGFVYLTDALLSKKVKVAVAVPRAEGPAITYPVAVLKAAKSPGEARKRKRCSPNSAFCRRIEAWATSSQSRSSPSGSRC